MPAYEQKDREYVGLLAPLMQPIDLPVDARTTVARLKCGFCHFVALARDTERAQEYWAEHWYVAHEGES
jgi:hypothetical protein